MSATRGEATKPDKRVFARCTLRAPGHQDDGKGITVEARSISWCIAIAARRFKLVGSAERLDAKTKRARRGTARFPASGASVEFVVAEDVRVTL